MPGVIFDYKDSLEVYMFIIVGLGNPGNKYSFTKHNIGFITAEYFAEQHNINISKTKYKALYGEGTIGGEKVIIAKPQTYMNLSGESVIELLNWYKVPISNLIVIYDDIDIDIGKLRIRPKGSAGTHNGMRSIIYHTRSEDFPRIRIGIGKPPSYMDLADYVISRFTDEEVSPMREAVMKASKAIEQIIKSGVDSAMNKFNG